MLTQGGGPVDPSDYSSIRVNGLIAAFLGLLTLQPVVTSCLIAAKLWASDRRLRARVGSSGGRIASRGSLAPVARIVLDSAGVYAATLLTMLILFLSGTTAFFIIMEAVVPIVALTFCGVITRVAAHASSLEHSTPVSHPALSPPAPHAHDTDHARRTAHRHFRASLASYGKRSRSGSPAEGMGNGVYEMPVVIRVSTERLSGIPDVPIAEAQELERGGEEDWEEGKNVNGWPFAEDM